MKWSASWIWHPPTGAPDNFYLYARREFTLDAMPKRARVFVTAGSLYKLYLNGRYVGRGPNPADPSHYYYDVHEVASLLVPGANVIAAVCYNYGPESKGVIGQNWGRGAFILELRAGHADTPLVVTDRSWKVIQAPEWDQSSPINCTLYADYKEYFDSRKELCGWMSAGFDDRAWREPDVLGAPPIEPYTRLVEREIPFLGGERVYPVNAFRESASVTYAWRDDWEVYHEQSLVKGHPHAAKGKCVEVFKTHADFSPGIILDFGRDVTGYPEIAIKASGGGIIDVLYGEDLRLVRVDRFTLKGGPQTLEPFNRRTFRYMKLLFQETRQRIEIERVSLKMDTYPVEYKGSFSCADPLLNRIWDVGRYTMRISMLDHFVDCPWRERTIYGGDVYNENLIAHYAFGDPRLNRKTLRQMFALQHDAGALPPYGPYRGCDSFYPSWAAFLCLAFLDHYDFTGDRAFLDELWPRFVRMIDWTIGELDANTPPLIGTPDARATFHDWSKAPKTRFGASSVFPFYLVMRRSADLASSLGRKDEAARCASAAARMGEAIRKHMIDDRGFAVPYPLTAHARPTQPDNAYLLWSGLLDADEAGALAAKLLSPELSPIDTPFHALFVAEGLFDHGTADDALAFIRSYFGSMLDRGATTFWEHFHQADPPGLINSSSLCHGWSAGPVYSLPAHVLGVRPLEPGFARILIEPRHGGLPWAKGCVPTPHGLCSVNWTRNDGEFHLSVNIPEGCTARVSLPALGTHETLCIDGAPVAPHRAGNKIHCDVPAGRHGIVHTRQ